MKKVDYIIVGCGLAGITFAEKLRKQDKSFVVFDDASQKSSIVAAGLYNPVILKRFTKVWQSHEQLAFAIPFYKAIEDNLKCTIDFQIPIWRLFHSIEEQNKWFEACDKPNVGEFLNTTILENKINGIIAPFGFGEVNQTGRVDTSRLIEVYREYLIANDLLEQKSFNYNTLEVNNDQLRYDNFQAKHIVFAEGFGLTKNPFFKQLPLVGNKGELLTIKAPSLKLNVIVKSGVFIIPLGNGLFRVGATYNREDKSISPTQEARQDLETKLQKFLSVDYEVINHFSAIRPTVKDRRPLVGKHHVHDTIFVLNGFGSRGVLMAPLMAEKLFNFIECGIPLDDEINSNRFGVA